MDDVMRYFADKDAAIEAFKIAVETDDNVLNYELVRHELDEDTMEYIEGFEYDLTEFVELSDGDSESVIIISDDEDEQ